MIRIEDSKKKVISIGHYKILDVLQTNTDKDMFHVQDLKDTSNEYMLKILKSNQNPKQIDNEIEVLNILNQYKENVYFYKLEIFSDKLLFVFDYVKGDNLLKLYSKESGFFDDDKIILFVKDMKKILNIYKKNNILHRNIKADSIIFDGEHYYMIGLTKAFIDKNLSQEEDKKAIVSILYFLLTGKQFEIEVNLLINESKEIYYKLLKLLFDEEEFTIEKIKEYIDKL